MIRLVVMTRHDCELCELLGLALQDHVGARATIEWRDVDSNESWQQRYGLKVPVVLDDSGITLMWGRFDPQYLPPPLREPLT